MNNTHLIGTVIVGALLALLTGCASHPAFEEGKRAMIAGDHENALRLFEEAAREEPDNRELRATLYRQREVAVSRWVTEAENARLAGKRDTAQQFVDKALRADPRHPRAIAMRELLERGQRHDELVAAARDHLAKKDYAAAEQKLRLVLAEDMNHAGARAAMVQVQEGRPQAPVGASALGPLFSRQVTLEFRDTSLRNVFEAIARSTGINFVFDKDVRADTKVTIFVRNTTVEEVMRLVLVTNQLDRRVLSDNTVLIFPNTAAKLRDYQELVTRSFFLVNADVKQVQNLIKTVVKTKDVYIDERLNLLVIKDSADAVRLAEQLIASVDVAEPEVMLEVEVLEVSRNRLKELGIDYPDFIGYGLLRSPTQTTTTTQNGVTVTGATVNSALGSEVASGVIDTRNRAGLTTYISNPALILNLKDTDGAANLLANPRIRVKNKEKAKVHIGEKLPVFTTTSTANVGVSASVSYLDVGLKLDVEPIIHPEDDVDIKMTLEVSSIVREVTGPQSSLAYQIGTRSTGTSLRLRNGETQILAGLISDEERTSASRLPGLGNLPIVGKLFSNERTNVNKTEIVLLITPRIVRNLARPFNVPPSLLAGTEAAVGAASLAVRNQPGQGMRLSSGGGAMPLPAPAVSVPQGGGPETGVAPDSIVALAMSGPSEARPGEEVAVAVVLPAQSGTRSATVELSYDAAVLQAEAGALMPGRAALALSAGDAQEGRNELRFKVIGKTDGVTAVQLGQVNVLGADGNPLPVVPPPPVQILIKP